MRIVLVILIVIAAVLALALVLGLIAMFFLFFFSPKFDRENPKPDILMGEELPRFVKETEKVKAKLLSDYPHESVSVRTDDGLTLVGDFFKNTNPTDKTVLCVHGYNSCGLNDFALMAEPILQRGYNCFLLNHRHYGGSEGRYTGFGILESRDLLKWIARINEDFPGGRIVLYGISMGAATVMQASCLKLPETVVGIVEDCGFTSASEEFRAVLKNVAHLPAFPAIPVLEAVCKLFLRLDIKNSDSRACVAQTDLPILFVHGTADAFIPAEMCRECYEACRSEKQMILYDGAAHAQSHFRHPEAYERDFFAFVDRVMQ